MTVDLVLRNCHVVRPSGILSVGIAIEQGKIVALAHDSQLPKADRTVDCHGNHVLPGVIDNHVHLGIYKAWRSDLNETAAAAAGGITTIGNYVGMGDVAWGQSYHAKMKEWAESYNHDAFVDAIFHFPIQSDIQLEEMESYYRKYKVNLFKFFPYLGQEALALNLQEVDDGLIYEGFQTAGRLGSPVTLGIHSENMRVVHRLKRKLIAAGRTDLPANTESRPQVVETLDVVKACYMARATKAQLYIVHVTAADSVDVLRKVKVEGQRVVTETCPHFLTLTKDMPYGPLGIEYPSLKERDDNESLWQGLADGTIDVVATDHCSSSRDQKTNIWTAKAGFPGCETLLPIILSEGVRKRGLPLTRVAEVLSQNPARLNRIYPRKGALEVGSDADMVIVDLKRTLKVSIGETLHYKISDYCLWEGWNLYGWPIMTILRGNVVFEDGAVTGKPGVGQYTERDL